jgi:hypothetical protein
MTHFLFAELSEHNLRKPAFPVKASVDPTFQPGEVVAGRFRILRQAGSGGVA